MHIRSVRLRSFKRFTDLTIELPSAPRLVMLCGPNGVGKSSLFDAFKMWHDINAGFAYSGDPLYFPKQGTPPLPWSDEVALTFHGTPPADPSERKKIFYFRSAYRNEPDFTVSNIQRTQSPLDGPRFLKLIDNDMRVSDNYQRLVSATVDGLFSGTEDAKSVPELRLELIGPIRESMGRLFPDLLLKGIGHPMEGGYFQFEKASASIFHYKNLSGGEKAAFDLILDLILKAKAFDNTIFCIDEPELHMNTRLQASLLDEMLRVIPSSSQLWLASHSIGMMRRARDLQEARPEEVIFLDFEGSNYELPVTLQPAHVDRAFWSRALSVALDDLAMLIAPKRVVLCEGRPTGADPIERAEFDAQCYRTIFGRQYPDTDFISIGNEADVSRDRLQIGRTIQALVPGTQVVRLIDRDDKSEQEVADRRRAGVRVLSRRQLESYLLDDEILIKLCREVARPTASKEVLEIKRASLADSAGRGNQVDDVKSASSAIYTKIKVVLDLRQRGNTTYAFLRDTLAPLVTPETQTYLQLRNDVFGETA